MSAEVAQPVRERKAGKTGMQRTLKVCKHCHRVNLLKARRCAECGKKEFETLRLLY